ncbi:hypothetical protein PRIPAC_86924 [Pristionchus pacificus]|uniref:Uncharacterized protein n=1 Tax=Pristionchus pacificus TaxID=54126 RepID=A0A2A6C9W8_PRIPA|nr:hypothetical protein PRIPAC_86924 [Pristionchus pacificus]|eukprot:PDM74853.1 hypothetical protein PRIPAC_43343 [Pristionchus pacificus]
MSSRDEYRKPKTKEAPPFPDDFKVFGHTVKMGPLYRGNRHPISPKRETTNPVRRTISVEEWKKREETNARNDRIDRYWQERRDYHHRNQHSSYRNSSHKSPTRSSRDSRDSRDGRDEKRSNGSISPLMSSEGYKRDRQNPVDVVLIPLSSL